MLFLVLFGELRVRVWECELFLACIRVGSASNLERISAVLDGKVYVRPRVRTHTISYLPGANPTDFSPFRGTWGLVMFCAQAEALHVCVWACTRAGVCPFVRACVSLRNPTSTDPPIHTHRYTHHLLLRKLGRKVHVELFGALLAAHRPE